MTFESFKLDWKQAPGQPARRIGRSKLTGRVLIEIISDDQGLEKEKIYYSDEGILSKRFIYELDHERRPKLTTVYDNEGKIIFRHSDVNGPKI
jgi:hypothetical protein